MFFDFFEKIVTIVNENVRFLVLESPLEQFLYNISEQKFDE